jgi:hypothetical protein
MKCLWPLRPHQVSKPAMIATGTPRRRCTSIYVDHLAWPLVVGALLVIAKRGAQPQTLAKVSGANCARTSVREVYICTGCSVSF